MAPPFITEVQAEALMRCCSYFEVFPQKFKCLNGFLFLGLYIGQMRIVSSKTKCMCRSSKQKNGSNSAVCGIRTETQSVIWTQNELLPGDSREWRTAFIQVKEVSHERQTTVYFLICFLSFSSSSFSPFLLSDFFWCFETEYSSQASLKLTTYPRLSWNSPISWLMLSLRPVQQPSPESLRRWKVFWGWGKTREWVINVCGISFWGHKCPKGWGQWIPLGIYF